MLFNNPLARVPPDWLCLPMLRASSQSILLTTALSVALTVLALLDRGADGKDITRDFSPIHLSVIIIPAVLAMVHSMVNFSNPQRKYQLLELAKALVIVEIVSYRTRTLRYGDQMVSQFRDPLMIGIEGSASNQVWKVPLGLQELFLGEVSKKSKSPWKQLADTVRREVEHEKARTRGAGGEGRGGAGGVGARPAAGDDDDDGHHHHNHLAGDATRLFVKRPHRGLGGASGAARRGSDDGGSLPPSHGGAAPAKAAVAVQDTISARADVLTSALQYISENTMDRTIHLQQAELATPVAEHGKAGNLDEDKLENRKARRAMAIVDRILGVASASSTTDAHSTARQASSSGGGWCWGGLSCFRCCLVRGGRRGRSWRPVAHRLHNEHNRRGGSRPRAWRRRHGRRLLQLAKGVGEALLRRLLLLLLLLLAVVEQAEDEEEGPERTEQGRLLLHCLLDWDGLRHVQAGRAAGQVRRRRRPTAAPPLLSSSVFAPPACLHAARQKHARRCSLC